MYGMEESADATSASALAPRRAGMAQAIVAHVYDVTLEEMKARLKLDCTVAAIQWVVTKLGLTYKKRLSMLASRVALTSPGPEKSGSGAKPASIPPGSSSSTRPRPKRT